MLIIMVLNPTCIASVSENVSSMSSANLQETKKYSSNDQNIVTN